MIAPEFERQFGYWDHAINRFLIYTKSPIFNCRAVTSREMRENVYAPRVLRSAPGGQPHEIERRFDNNRKAGTFIAQLQKRCDQVPLVRGNDARLGQVFLNLLVNAAQAIPVGHAADNQIVVSVYQRDERVIVEISDTGIVMELGRLFMVGPAAEIASDPRIKIAYLGGQ